MDIRIGENNKRGIAECLLGLSSVMQAHADHDTAVKMLGAVEAARSADPGLFLPVDQRELARSFKACTKHAGRLNRSIGSLRKAASSRWLRLWLFSQAQTFL